MELSPLRYPWFNHHLLPFLQIQLELKLLLFLELQTLNLWAPKLVFILNLLTNYLWLPAAALVSLTITGGAQLQALPLETPFNQTFATQDMLITYNLGLKLCWLQMNVPILQISKLKNCGLAAGTCPAGSSFTLGITTTFLLTSSQICLYTAG